MLPTEPQSKLTVSKAWQSTLGSAQTFLRKDSIRQFARKSSSLIMKHPFWVLVISSLGAHAAFALILPNPLKQTESPREVIVSTLPVVKLPSRQVPTNSKQSQSLVDNLFVKSLTNKLDPPLNVLPSTSFPSFDLNTSDSFENLPPVSNDLQFPPLLNNSPEIDSSRTPPLSRTPPSGQIDNITPAKTPNSNLKPEFQSNGLKTGTSSPDPEIKNPKDTSKDAKNVKGAANIDQNEKAISNVSSLYSTDKQIIDLVSRNLIRTTQIAPENALVSNPDLNREKGITWIPLKIANVTGKKGAVTFMWLVAPSGEIEAKFLKSSGHKELDDIARESLKDYKFKPIEDLQSGKYRLVTAKYDFP